MGLIKADSWFAGGGLATQGEGQGLNFEQAIIKSRFQRFFVRCALAGVLTLLVACGDRSERFAEGWAVGGTLHDKTLREWAFATDANRLATAADFVKDYGLAENEEVHRFGSALLEHCLSKMAQGSPVEFIKVASQLDRCFDYAGKTAAWIAKDLNGQTIE